MTIFQKYFSRRFFFFFILLFYSNSIYPQAGNILVKLPIKNKDLLHRINFTFIENVVEGEITAYKDSRFSYPYKQEKIREIISKRKLLKRRIKKLYSVVRWDVKKQEGILIGYAPSYNRFSDSTLYYISADILAKLDSSTGRKLREACRLELNRKTGKPEGSNLVKNGTIRSVKFSRYSDIRQFPMSGLPSYLVDNFKEEILTFYSDRNFKTPLDMDDVRRIAKESMRGTNIDKVYLFEYISDSFEYNNNNPELYFLPSHRHTIRLNTKAIGLKITPKTIIWADYQEVLYISDSDRDAEGYSAFDVYKLYFESEFCRRVGFVSYK